MKKRIKTMAFSLLIFAFLMGFTSCKKEIKELKLSGARMSTEQLTKYVDDFNAYEEAIKTGNQGRMVSSNWYDFSAVCQENIEGANSTIKADVKMKGEFHDAPSVMDMRMKIKANIDMDVDTHTEKENYKTKYKCKMTMILIDGIWWLNGKIVMDGGKNYKLTSQICKKVEYDSKISLNIGDINDVDVNFMEYINMLLPFSKTGGSIMEQFGREFIRDLKNYSGEGETAKVFKEGNTLYKSYGDQYSEGSNAKREKCEFEENTYLPKTIEAYEYSKTFGKVGYEESTSYMKISKKMMGIIGAPANKNKYGW